MTAISHTAVHLALRGPLLSVTGVTLRAKENKSFTPTPGQAYAEDKLLPGTRAGLGLSTDSPQEYTGLYKITYHGLADSGLDVSTTADAILAKYPRTLVLTATDGTVVRMRSLLLPTRSEVTNRDRWAICVIRVPYLITA